MSQSVSIAADQGSSTASSELELAIRRWGYQIFDLMDAAGEPSLLSRKGFYGAIMNWAMQDERFKTQLFRFIDVLPSLTSSREIARHLQEYLGPDQVKLSSALRLALKSSTKVPALLGWAIKSQTSSLARQFMLGNVHQEIAATLRQLRDEKVGFTVDVLGETVVSEVEAAEYTKRYLELLDFLARETSAWPAVAQVDTSPHGPVPRLNLSIKISALYSQIQAADPDTAIARISTRLRPLLRRARELGAFVNFDMEQDTLKNLTLRLFKTLFSEQEFAREPASGLALQAYLTDAEEDLRALAEWAHAQERRVTVRLVKGAYWDYEMVHADQKGWPVPVFTHKAETDASFERLSLILLRNHEILEPAFGTHNVRSIAHVLAQAERLRLLPGSFEFQMLYGMAGSTKRALVQLGHRVREYTPVGELLPGMAYLVRRLLENTSNEGFLAKNYQKRANRDELLEPPVLPSTGAAGYRPSVSPDSDERAPGTSVIDLHSDTKGLDAFRNEPPTDFTQAPERERMRAALIAVRASLGRRYPLVINNRPVQTSDWLPSRNPARQEEVIGYAAQGGTIEADAALAAAHAAAPEWSRRPGAERAQFLERVADAMRRRKYELCAWEILEAGKSWSEADADVAEAIDFCNFYAMGMRALAVPERTQMVRGESNVQHWRARGVGLVIAPWNFPLAILTGMTAAAVVAGNPVVMKPSDQTPVIAAVLMSLLIEAGLPRGVVNLVSGPGSTVGAYLAAHAGIDFIAFTGSKEVGLKIWEMAGRTAPGQPGLKKAICEMGGKNAIIIDTDADLDEAVAGSVASAFGYQGQKCSALSRLIVLADAYERFLPRLIAATASLPTGPAEEPGTIVGPVISPEAQQRILKRIDAGKSEANLAWQGTVPDAPDACYVPPTIFTDVPLHSPLFQEEIFGPVLAVTRARDFEEALALANATEFALTAGLYSRSPSHIERARQELECGNLYINRPITGAIVGRQPFGGFKMSGGGTKAGGLEYLHNFMIPCVITENQLRRGFAPEVEGL